MQLDHLILAVRDVAASVEFYTAILGLTYDGERPPFALIRVTPDLVLQLAPWGSTGGEHLAFSMSRAEFEQVFTRIRAAGLPYGDAFDAVGNGRGPGEADGAHGVGQAVYCFDPSEHLIEIRHDPGAG